MSKRTQTPHTRPPIRRMLFIHEQLKSGRYPNCRQFCEEMEVGCTRTILRDIAFMREQLMLPIEYDGERRGYYYSRPVEHFPGVAVSESELFALLVAQKAVAHYRGTPFHKPLRTAFEKLTSDMDHGAVVHLERLGEAMDIRVSGPEDVNEELFQVVCRGVQQHRPLKFQYRKLAAKGFQVRRVHPYQVVCVNSRWYLIGHDLKREDMRVFVLGRMRGVEVLSGMFQRPADFRVEDFLKNSFGIFRGKEDFEVVVELDAWAADVSRGRMWHGSQTVQELPGGGMRVTFRLDNLEEVEPWVLSWGAHATVVRPRKLVERVRRAVVALAERY